MNRSQTPLTIAFTSIARDAAARLIDAARAACRDIGIEATIAITDAGGHLKALDRTDGAPFLTVDVAVDKAWTAASFGLGTHVWNGIVKDPVVAPLAHRPRLVAVGGGCPIVHEGRVVGGIGISGGNALQDRQAAEIALKTLGFEIATA
ncbi:MULTISPECIES: heme-binding protein [unclassified Rhizobacter]|uniref:GlcG/HbpS family heme-binding protein n=1 Tax=unclassified Rhizobacter TaxID=2640088 RepID=UPI0006F2D0DE|nr:MULTISPECIES: heme-binding protein [unclassified Rhizobacter]KQU64432.1 hypothetical protein ASC88_12085 [Rhizobacter sp. Root29]KQW11486.1 hypothetical protein ASC98_21285 [Rhizobacter sp. Root1238]KRB19743.1 hypothetical protein ASE08_23110 [Rhizobacter sp. Root16D2]